MPPELRGKFTIQEGDLTLYRAGLPNGFNPVGFQSNFTRDGIQAAILFKDPYMLADQLKFSAYRQANKKDPRTGAEPGKPHHEYPGVEIRGLSTEYNACDSAAWFLIGFYQLARLSQDYSLPNEYRREITSATDYIISHLATEGLFQESPEFSGAERFALNVTYWKDSQIPQREGGQPAYPVVYSLVQAQNLEGLRNAASLLDSRELRGISERMNSALQRMFSPNLGTFSLAHDRMGVIDVISSDILTSLYFLRPEDLTELQLRGICRKASILETPAGFRTLDPEVAATMEDKYHAETVWPSEQALIHAGARKFKEALERKGSLELSAMLGRVEEVSGRVMSYLGDNNTEIFVVNGDQIVKGGCDPQLWTLGAKSYFARINTPSG